jgi:gliding motility-associated-like protein
MNPVYAPSTADVTVGIVILTMHLTGIAPCEAYDGQVILTIAAAPTAKAGNDATICNSSSYTLGNTSATNYSSLFWEFIPVNVGTITNETTLNPTFIPASGYTGVVSLTLKTYGSLLCGTVVANDIVVLTIVSGISVSAGADQFISAGTGTTLQGSVTGGTGAYAWSWEPSALLVNTNIPDPLTVALNQQTVFTLTVLDIITGCSSQDSVVVNVGIINHPPVAADDYDTTAANTPVSIQVLSNDSDLDGDPLTVSLCGTPANGVVILNKDKTFTYTPYDKYIGDDQFCYTICDNRDPSLCDTATVYIHIKASINDLVIYNLLTPNGDNNNDIWHIRGIEDYPDNTILIFNRWGDKVRDFSRYDNKSVFWDGSNSKGETLPSSTYYYILTIKNVGSRTGWIYIRSNEE